MSPDTWDDLTLLPPIKDNKIIYSFHMYEPYDFTSNNNFTNGGKYVYPGKIMFGSEKIWWDSAVIELYEAEILCKTTAVPSEAVTGRALFNVAALARAR